MNWDFIVGLIEPFFFWFKNNLLKGILYYIIIYVIFVIAFLPSTFLTLGGAVTFSIVMGPVKAFFLYTLIVMFCQVLGAIIAFFLARYFMQSFIRKHIIHRIKLFKAID